MLQGILEPLDIDADAALVFAHGQPLTVVDAQPDEERAIFAGGRFVGIGRTGEGGRVQPARVFAPPDALA